MMAKHCDNKQSQSWYKWLRKQPRCLILDRIQFDGRLRNVLKPWPYPRILQVMFCLAKFHNEHIEHIMSPYAASIPFCVGEKIRVTRFCNTYIYKYHTIHGSVWKKCVWTKSNTASMLSNPIHLYMLVLKRPHCSQMKSLCIFMVNLTIFVC